MSGASAARRHLAWLWAGLTAAAASVGLVWLLPIAEWLGAFEAWIAGLGLWGIALFAVIYILAAILLAPEWPLSVGAGLAWGIWGVPLVLVAGTIGAGAAFLVARYLARPRVRAFVQGRRRLAAIDAAVAEEGWKIVALARLSPVLPFSLQSYVFGATAIPFRDYVAATAMGIVPCTALYVYLGVLGGALGRGDASLGLLEWLFLVVGLAATAAGGLLVARKAAAKLRAAGIADRRDPEVMPARTRPPLSATGRRS